MWNQLNHHYENNYYEINLTNEMTKNPKECEKQHFSIIFVTKFNSPYPLQE